MNPDPAHPDTANPDANPPPPRRMIAGIGFRDAATPASLLDALARAGAGDVRRLAVPAAKARHPAVAALAQSGYHITVVCAAAMIAAPTLTESAASRAAHGTGSVSEGCALAALGPGAVLCGPRAVSGDARATAALATAPQMGPHQSRPKGPQKGPLT